LSAVLALFLLLFTNHLYQLNNSLVEQQDNDIIAQEKNDCCQEAQDNDSDDNSNSDDDSDDDNQEVQGQPQEPPAMTHRSAVLKASFRK